MATVWISPDIYSLKIKRRKQTRPFTKRLLSASPLSTLYSWAQEHTRPLSSIYPT